MASGWLAGAGARLAPETGSAQILKVAVQRRMFWFTVAFMTATAPVYLFLVWRTSGGRSTWWWALLAGYAAIWSIAALGARSGDFRRALWWLHTVVFACLLMAALERVSVSTSAFWWMSVMPVVVILSGMTRLGLVQGAVVIAYAAAAYRLDVDAHGMPPAFELRLHVGVALSTVFVVAYLTLAARWRAQLQQALEAAMQASAQAVEAKTRFVANLGHEIRNTLAGVIGAAELLRSPRSSEPQRAQLIALQEQSARSLLSLINDMLDWAKLDAGKVELANEPFCPRTLVLEVNETFAVPACAKGIDIACSCEPDVPLRLRGDAARIRQVLHNLVGNAVKFTSQGRVHIRLALGGEPSAVPGGEGAVPLRFEVEDSGVGIAPDQLARVFDAFSQGDGARGRREGGTGLGLAICRELATLMRGCIEVTSTPRTGSTFALLVALESVEPAPVAGDLLRDVTVATADPTLERQIRCVLHALGREPDVRTSLRFEPEELSGRRLLIVDEPLLAEHGDASAWLLADAAAAGVQPVVLLPLSGRTAVASPTWRATVLHKPLRPAAVAELLGVGVDGAAAPPPRDTPLRSHVLLCEDNPVNQVIVQAMLDELGAECVTVANGFEALERLRSQRFDLVLMDMEMPGLDGVEVTRRWRAVEEGGSRRTPVVALTGADGAEAWEAWRAAGLDGFMSKPFDLADLCATLHRHAAGPR